MRAVVGLLAVLAIAPPLARADEATRESVGPTFSVVQGSGQWTIAGARTKLTLRTSDLALDVDVSGTHWSMAPSISGDLLVKSAETLYPLRLADARRIAITPYHTGFRSGVKAELSDWRHPSADARGDRLGLTLFLTLGLEGRDEELVASVAAEEGNTAVRQLDWPGPLDAGDVEYTVLPHLRGALIPRGWPQEFDPIRPPRTQEGAPQDSSAIQSNVIESWSMSWWGFRKNRAAMMIIVETPDDAAYQFQHPAGGPTVIGPRWRASLGRLGYPRTARLCFFPEGDYVALAKRYRRYAMETGLFVSLREKIARRPEVKALIGTPLSRVSILRNLKEDSQRYDRQDSAKNYSLTSFDERARQIGELKTKGLERFHVCLTGWPRLGYDRQHPDELPPAAQAGGWDGLKRLTDAVRALGYLLTFHDQYRDYYVDAPSYDPQLAIHEEDDQQPPQAFPGTRFGSWKQGRVPFMNHWDGGTQTYLNSRFMLGHLRRNYDALADHGIRPDGIYLDVFGYVPPDEDWSREHPTTRSDNLRDRAACYRWTRERLGIVGTEAACDWTVPYADISSPLRPARAVPVPLFELVYHDAILTTYDPTDLRGLLHGGLPQVAFADVEKQLAAIRRMAALNERLAHVEMTGHEFRDANRRSERTTFADGTTVTVDWDAQTVSVSP
jgi:hypothetical protein